MEYIEVKDYEDFGTLAITHNLSIPLMKSTLSLNTSQVNMRNDKPKTIISDEE